MKNLLLYINPRRDFGLEEKVTAKIQIDNSLDLGWKKEDILLFTNFPYEYNGVKATIISDEGFFEADPAMSKTNVIINLLVKRLIGKTDNKEKKELYWFHDFDVFQNSPILESEIELELGTAQLGLTDKGRMPRWNFGTLFFKGDVEDLFSRTMEIAYKYDTTDEAALMVLYTNNLLWATEAEPEVTIGDRIVPANIPGMENADKRIKKINITYNFRMWNIRSTYKMAIKPIRAFQFHPFADILFNSDLNELGFFMYGRNKINTVLMSDRLIKIFHKHGVR